MEKGIYHRVHPGETIQELSQGVAQMAREGLEPLAMGSQLSSQILVSERGLRLSAFHFWVTSLLSALVSQLYLHAETNKLYLFIKIVLSVDMLCFSTVSSMIITMNSSIPTLSFIGESFLVSLLLFSFSRGPFLQLSSSQEAQQWDSCHLPCSL